MNDERPDAALVVAFLEGDHHALAAIYDRYSGALYDTAAAMLSDRHEAADATQDVFLVATERLAQLRDGTRLRAWLFAVLRNEVYRRSARRRRTRPTDFTAGDDAEMAAPHGPAADAAGVELSELAAEVRAAAGGLEQRDQLVLELVARQQLRGDDLAAALGVSVQQSYVLVNRMRDRVERSLGALAVARAGRRDCPQLTALLTGWDGHFDVQIRKRVARHVDGCAACTTTRRRVGALALVAAAPAFAAPATLRDAVLTTTTGSAATLPDSGRAWPADGDGFPRSQQLAPRRATLLRRVALAAAAAIAAVAVVGAVLGGGGDDDSSPAPAALPTSAISAPGAQTTDVAGDDSTVPGTAPPADVDPPPTSSTTPASTTTDLVVVTTTSDPFAPPSGPLVLVAATTSTTVVTDATEPAVELVTAPSSLTCPWSAAPFVTADVVDDSTVDVVTLAWSGPGEAGETPMSRSSGSSWTARLGVDRVNGTWTFVVTAVDAAGNLGTASRAVVVTGC